MEYKNYSEIQVQDFVYNMLMDSIYANLYITDVAVSYTHLDVYKRQALARALVNRPDILLADEPTGNLDPKNANEIMKLLEEINARGTTVLVVTHNKEIVNAMKKRVIRLRKGVIISDEKEGVYVED